MTDVIDTDDVREAWLSYEDHDCKREYYMKPYQNETKQSEVLKDKKVTIKRSKNG